MTYYIHVENDKIISSGECPMGEPFISIEVTEEQYNQCLEYGINYFVYDNGELIVNPNYEEEQAEKERERVGNLQVTKRVFALALQQLGISYSQLKATPSPPPPSAAGRTSGWRRLWRISTGENTTSPPWSAGTGPGCCPSRWGMMPPGTRRPGKFPRSGPSPQSFIISPGGAGGSRRWIFSAANAPI